MSINFYLIFHLISLIVFISSLTHLLLSSTSSKIANIIYGISGVTLFVAGFGLLAKYKLAVTTTWVMLKLLIWAGLVISVPIVVKRAPHLKRSLFYVTMGALFFAIFLVILQPN